MGQGREAAELSAQAPLGCAEASLGCSQAPLGCAQAPLGCSGALGTSSCMGDAGLGVGSSVWSPWGFARGRWWLWDSVMSLLSLGTSELGVWLSLWAAEAAQRAKEDFWAPGAHPSSQGGIQGMGVTWPSPRGLSWIPGTEREGKSSTKRGLKGCSSSPALFPLLLCPRTSHKTSPRKIHSYNPTIPFFPSLLFHGEFPGDSW